MEPIQKAHIQKNWVGLIKNTDCNVLLLSKLQECGVLSDCEYEDLHSLGSKFEKSRKLYEILLTKTNAYGVTLKALNELRQTGAHQILQYSESKILFKDFGLISVETTHLLGEGRSGTRVYRGKFDGRDVAVKVIKEEPDEAIREVEFLKKLDDHPNIVRYFIAEPKNDKVYIALELCLINLEEEMKMRVVKPEQKNVLISCTEGLAFLHKNGILHRDLKPANILLNRHGLVKISDFGFSKQLEAGRSAASASGVVGTADWMAPELHRLIQEEEEESEIKITAKTTAKADIFSLGCIFYFVFSGGRHLFGKPLERSQNIVKCLPQWGNVHLEDSIKELITNMIAKFPAQRPSAEQILAVEYFSNSYGSKSSQPCQTQKTVTVDTKLAELDNCSLATKHEPDTTLRTKKMECENLNSVVSTTQSSISKTKNQNKKTKMFDIALHKTRLEEIANQCNVLPEMFEKFLLDINTTDEFGNTMLHMVALNDDSVKSLEYLIDLGVDWKICNDRNLSVLHFAAEGGKYNVVQYLINIGIDVNCRSVERDTPLHRIALAKNNFLETLEVLVKNGADINAVNVDGINLVLAAAINGFGKKELQKIVDLGGVWNISDRKGHSVLHKAAGCGNYQAVQYFTELGADVNIKDLDGSSPIHYTVFTDAHFPPTLKALVEHGAAVNAVNKKDMNLLMLAIIYLRSVDDIKAICKLGGDWKLGDSTGRTVFHFASNAGHCDAIKYFKSIGADINLKNLDGEPPIFYSLGAKNFLETLGTLVENEADIKAVDNGGQNIVFQAVVQKKSSEELKEIIGLGGNWKALNYTGHSVLHLAAKVGNFTSIKTLVQLGANVSIRDPEGCTPIHYIVRAQTHFLETLNTLLECGADINVVSKDGLNVLWSAVVAKRSLAEITAIVELGGNWKASTNSGISILHYCQQTHNLDALAYFRSLNNNN